MISGLDPLNEQFLASINTLQARMNKAQNQVSSGLRVTIASDAPQSVGDIFQARTDLAHVTQVDQNLAIAKSQVDSADSSLQSAIQLLENAAVLGGQGANTSTTAGGRSSLAAQVQSILEQVVGLSRTQVGGVFIFSGDAATSPAYVLDSNSDTGVTRLVTAGSTGQVADPTGVTFLASKTAQDIFDKRDDSDGIAPENAFAALNSLQKALQSGDTDAIGAAIQSVKAAGDYLNQQLGFYGAAQNRISASIDLAKKFELQDQAQLGALQDADIPTAALELTQATTGLNAAMSARAKRPTTSLFDFLPS
jgi:flagellar hook-associated protein 3 FlgL